MSDTIETTPETQTIAPAFNNLLDEVEMKFRWGKDDLGNQRPKVEGKGFVPSVEGLVEILTKGGKGLELLREAVYDTVRSAVSGWLNSNESATFADIPWAEFTWDKISSTSKEDRTKISDETWKAFAADYIAVMPAATNKTVDAVTNATIVYLKKFSIVKTDKKTLKKLQDQLALYVEHSPNAEAYTEILTVLNSKLDTYLKADDVQMLVSNL